MSGSTKKELLEQVARLNRKLKEAETNYDAAFKCLEARDAIEADLKARLTKADIQRIAWRKAWIAIVGPGPQDLRYADERVANEQGVDLSEDLIQDKDFRDRYQEVCRENSRLREKVNDERCHNSAAWGILTGRHPMSDHASDAVVTEAQRVVRELDQWRRSARSAFICRDTFIKYNQVSTEERSKLIEERNRLQRDLRVALASEKRAQDRNTEYYEAQLAAENRVVYADRRVSELETQLNVAHRIIRTQAHRHIETYCTWRRRIHEAEERATKAENRVKHLEVQVTKGLRAMSEAADLMATNSAPMYTDLLDYAMDVDKELASIIECGAKSSEGVVIAVRHLLKRSPLPGKKLVDDGVRKNHAPTGAAYDLHEKQGTPVPCEHPVVHGGPGTRTCRDCGVVMRFDGRRHVPVAAPKGCKVEPLHMLESTLFNPIFNIDGFLYTPLTNEMLLKLGDAHAAAMYAAGRIRQYDAGDFSGKVIRVGDVL